MKNIFTLLFFLISISAFAQPSKLVTRNGTLVDSSVINAPGYAKININTDNIAANTAAIATKQDSLNWYMPEQYGAVGDGITNDAAAFQAMHDAMPSTGGHVYLSAKTYRINTEVRFTKRLTIVGVGKYQTILNTTSGTINMFNTTGNYTAWRDVHFTNTSATRPTAGSAIYDSLGIWSSFTDIMVDSFYNGLKVDQTTLLRVTNCDFRYYVNNGVALKNSVNPDSGDESFVGCNFFGSISINSNAGIRWESGGGLKITNCKFNTASATFKPAYGIDAAINNTSIFLCTNNSFENYRTIAIKMTTSATAFSLVNIGNNQFSSYNSSTADIDINGINNVTVSGNTFVYTAGNAVKLTSVSGAVVDNFYPTGYTTPVSLTTCTNIVNRPKGFIVGTTLTDIGFTGGNVALGIAQPANSAQLDIANGNLALLFGADNNAVTRTNVTTKIARIAMYPYTNANASWMMFNPLSSSTSNVLAIGGGSSALNAATEINLYTAANNNTVTGTLRAKVNTDGFFSSSSGAAVASAATITPTGNLFHVTGTTTITSIAVTGASGTAITSGTEITIIFDGALTLTDGSNLKLAGDFITTVDDVITLKLDGANWYEKSRSIN